MNARVLRALACSVGFACSLGLAMAAPPTNGTYQHFHFKEQRFHALDRSQVAIELPAGVQLAQVAGNLATLGLDVGNATPSPIRGWYTVPTMAGSDTPAAIEAIVQALANDPMIAFASPVFSGDEGMPYWPSRFLVVEFSGNAGAVARQNTLAKVNAKGVDFRWAIMPNAARVELNTKSGFEALESSNALAVANETTFAECDNITTGKHNLIPNDTFFGDLWGIHNTGQAGGTVDADMDGVEAWDITTGSNAVITIIMDVGVQQAHPDLNSGPGNDFTGNGSGGEPINACDNHGTAVASCISGRINNGLGVVGIAPATRTSSTNIGVSNLACNGSWSGFLSWSADAINWGVGIGARVSNNSNSYGSTSAAVETAYLNSYNNNNMVHFASAGNSGAGSIAYPSSIPIVNSVAALNRTGARASFSQFGTGLDFSAPGQTIYACDRTGSAGYVAGDYVIVDGTSFASPYAAGVAALVISRNPALTSAQVETIMRNTAVDLGTAGYDTGFGWGFVNANNAVIAAAPPPGNDTCVGATAIGLGAVSGNNTFATTEGATSCGFNVQRDVYYRFTPTCSATYRFDTCRSPLPFDTVLSIHSGCPADLTTQITCNDDNGVGACAASGLASRIDIALTAGTTYYIRLGGYNNQAGDFTLTVSRLDNFPTNDACTAAIPMVDGTPYTGDTSCATNDGTSNCGSTGTSNDVWYSYTPTCGGTYTFESCGSGYDTVLSLHSGCPGTSGNTIACNDDSCGLQSRISANLTAGTTYLLRVGGFAGNRAGPFTVQVIRGADTYPPNDLCANAIDVSAGGTYNGTLVCAANDSNAGGCGASSSNPDVWYSYTNSTCNPRRLTVSTCGSNASFGIDTVLSILSACGGTEIACNDDDFVVCSGGGTLDSATSAVVNPGETVKIRVSKFGGRIIAPFTLNVSSSIANDNCAEALLVPAGTYAWCNNGTTTDGPGACGAMGSDLWFRYTATAAGVVTVTTCGSSFDTVSAVYPDGCPAGAPIACNDDDFNIHCGSGYIRDSWLQFGASAGVTYLIRVGGFASLQGNGSLTIDLIPSGCYGSCVSDFDDGSGIGTPDGGTTIDDLLYYLAIFEAGDLCADVDDGSFTNTLDGGVTIDDLLYYLFRFEQGC